MADNKVVNAGAGGATIATDEIGGVDYQRVKVVWGADGTANDANASTPLPVVQTGALSPGSAAANLGKVEDGAHASGDLGVMALSVRQDTAAALAGTDADYQPLITDGSGRLHVTGPVTDGGGSLTVDGSVTANAGTNLNTSLLALEAGGNLAAAAASLSVMDDWDESDRAKVNPIAGQAGVQGGSGTTNALTQRVVLATDVALPAGTNAIGKLSANSGVDIGDVDVTSSALPTGAATSANQSTAITSLQLLDDTVFAEDTAAVAADKGIAILAVRRDADTTLVGTDNDYANLQVNAAGSLKVAITAGAGSGGTSIADGASFTRDTTSITPAGAAVETAAPTLTNGDVAALSMTTTGALRVSVASGGIAAVVEDAASAGGEDGVMMLAVRRDAASSGVGTDGDFAALSVTSDGSLRVSGSSGTTQYTEDAASAGAESLCLAGSVRRDTAASSAGTDGDYATLNTDANGRLHVITGPSTSTIEVVGDVAHDAVAAGNPVLAGAYASAAAPTDVSADADAVRLWALRSGALAVQETLGGVLAVAGNGAAGTGVPRVTLANDSTGNIATIGTSVTPGTAAANLGKAEDAAHASADVGVMALSVRQNTAAATSGTDGDYQPLITDTNGRLHVIAGATTGTAEVVGDVADDAVAAGNPVLVCGVAVEMDGTDPTTVSAENDAAQLRTDRARRLLVSEHHPRSFFTSADYASAQTNASVQAAPGASLSLYITDIVISNGATAGKITLLDGSGGTVKFTLYPAINGGASVRLSQPIRLTANTALCITSTTVTTHSVNVGGYIAP